MKMKMKMKISKCICHADVLSMFFFIHSHQNINLLNRFVQISFKIVKCICHADVLFMFDFHTFKSKYQTNKWICPNGKTYLSKMQNVFVMLMYYLCLLRAFFIHSDGKIFEEKLWQTGLYFKEG